MGRTSNNLAWRMRTKRERSSAGLVAKWGQKIARRPSHATGQYKLGVSVVRQDWQREKAHKRKAQLQALWGDHANAVLTKAMAKSRAQSLIRLVNTSDTRAELDASQRARNERARVLLGYAFEATQVTYARCVLAPLKDQPEREWPVVRAYHRTPQLGGIAKSRWTNRRDVWQYNARMQ